MSERQRVVFIVNPVAGKGLAGRELVRLRHLIGEREIPSEIFLTESGDDYGKLLDGLRLEDKPLIVAVGGDGTIHGLALAALEREVGPIGILPVGSGNDFARLAGISTDMETGLDALLNGVNVRWDVGQIGEHPFINSMGLGLSAEVSEQSRHTGPLRGLARYGLATIKAILKHHAWPIALDGVAGLDGPREITMAEIAIGRDAGGGFRLAPDASPADGLLDLCLVDAMPRWKIPLLAPRTMKGTHLGHDKVHYRQLSGFRLKLPTASTVHVDGELIHLPKAEHVVRLRAGALLVRVAKDEYGAAAAV